MSFSSKNLSDTPQRELPIIYVEMYVFSLLIAKQINELYLHNSILTTRVKEMPIVQT